MAITEESRHRLYDRLEESLGHDEATTLMELLPPVGWADVATKRDLDTCSALLRADMDHGFAAVRAEFAAVRAEMDHGFAAVRAEFAAVRAEMASGFAAVRLEAENCDNRLRADFRRDLHHHTFAVVAANASLFGLALAIARVF